MASTAFISDVLKPRFDAMSGENLKKEEDRKLYQLLIYVLNVVHGIG